MNKFYRLTGTAAAGVTLAASAMAFSAPYAAAQPDAHQAITGAAIAAPAPAPQPMIPAALQAGPNGISNIRTVGSTNWAGYAVHRSGEKFRRISATFFVPFLNCAVTPGNTDPGVFSAHWVGLDGFSSTTVEQDGIGADCSSGSPTYFAWREVFPRPEQPFTLKIKPGNSITASVRFSPSSGKYRLEVRDNTTGHHRTVHEKCVGSCKRSSAEVISEAPTVNGKQASLADYGALGFAAISITNGSGRKGGIKSSHWSRVKIEQVGFSSKNVIGQPTALNGRSFANYWLGQN